LKLHAWMARCFARSANGSSSAAVYSDECIPESSQRCASRLETMAERKLLLMRDPRAVALAIAHSAAAKQRSKRSAANRNAPPDVRLSTAPTDSVAPWVLQHFDAIAAEIAFRYECTVCQRSRTRPAVSRV
jgi:hypothetical protein